MFIVLSGTLSNKKISTCHDNFFLLNLQLVPYIWSLKALLFISFYVMYICYLNKFFRFLVLKGLLPASLASFVNYHKNLLCTLRNNVFFMFLVPLGILYESDPLENSPYTAYCRV